MNELEEEKRVQVMKEKILVDDQKNLKKLKRQFTKDNDYDGSHGQCCCKWDNH